jgi:dimethylaniline monooxygenase (N-oxide forming)
LKVAILGAGPSGLATLKTLRQSGLDARCFEAGDRVGGQWVIDNPSGTSAAYRSLRTNTNRAMSRFTDFAFPDDYPEYPSHVQMAAWFERYARAFGLIEHVLFDARVESVEPADSTDPEGGGFVVAAKGRPTERFDAVVAATGNLWEPFTPLVEGHFEGPTIHAKHYRDPKTPLELAGKRVLVVGLGNSGCEIAAELAREAEVYLSARSGNFILPRLAPGQPAPPHPSEPIPRLFRWLPVGAREALFRAGFNRALLRMAGDRPSPETLGLPPLPPDPFQKRAVVNDEILGLLAAGRVSARPALRRLRGSDVEFEDGSSLAVDAIVHATGYRFTLPFFSREVLGVDDAADLRLYQGIMHPKHPRLFVIGVMRVFCSIWPQAEQQALWVAARLRGRFTLPGPRLRERQAYPILRGPLRHCPFRSHDLRRQAGAR